MYYPLSYFKWHLPSSIVRAKTLIMISATEKKFITYCKSTEGVYSRDVKAMQTNLEGVS